MRLIQKEAIMIYQNLFNNIIIYDNFESIKAYNLLEFFNIGMVILKKFLNGKNMDIIGIEDKRLFWLRTQRHMDT